MMKNCGLLILIASLALCAGFEAAQDAYDVRAHYTKSEVMIPMRDGVKLFTIIYTPKDTTQKYPILITRTAYSIAPYGLDNYRNVVGPNNEFAKEGYIVAYQDTRGKFKSEGDFIHHRPIIKRTGQRSHRHLRHNRLARQECP